MIRFPVSRPCIGDAERDHILVALARTELTHGAFVEQFETALAAYLGARYCVAAVNGTAALHLALAAAGLGPGDEVLVPDLTYVATANAVRYTGARVVLVDADPETWCMSFWDAERKLTSRTRAILLVHLYGNPCDMAAFGTMAACNHLAIFEDNAEGLGGAWRGHALGTLGHAGMLSFYGNKVLTTGEGGAVITDNLALRENMRLLRGQGMSQTQRYFHTVTGYNYRMTALQAAVGCGQLTHLEDMLQKRRAIFARYASRLGCSDNVPRVLLGARPAPWLYTLQVGPGRDELAQRLARRGVETRPTFVPLHRMPMYRQPDDQFPNASRLGDEGLSLPTYPELTLDEVDQICDIFVEEEIIVEEEISECLKSDSIRTVIS